MIRLRVQLINFHTFVFAVSLRMIPIVKICLKKMDITRSTESEQCKLRKFLWCVEYSVALINYAAPQNQHVGIIFCVNCPEDSLFTVVEFFNFQVHFPCKWEVLFWTKQRNKLFLTTLEALKIIVTIIEHFPNWIQTETLKMVVAIEFINNL